MIIVGKIKFKTESRLYTFQSEGLNLKSGDSCIVKTAAGLRMGEVIVEPCCISFEPKCLCGMMKAIRKATAEDKKRYDELASLEEEAFKVCENRIEERELNMKLVGVEVAFDKSKILFYFRSETRVDFRELVKDLAHQFRTRIELRQIGVRDEARMIGGMGCCGRPLCCVSFLQEFTPVSIKMAKKQSLALNPTKISGQCGRLMCCIQYEYACYTQGEAQGQDSDEDDNDNSDVIEGETEGATGTTGEGA